MAPKTPAPPTPRTTMARRRVSPSSSMSGSPSRAFVGFLFALVFLAMSAAGLYTMRLGHTTSSINDKMLELANSKIIKEFDNTELRYEYLGSMIPSWLLSKDSALPDAVKEVIAKGVGGLDFGLRFLVVAFLPGCLDFDRGIQLQSAYFLLSFVPVLVVMSVEAGRVGNRWGLISLTSIWALFYQTTGGAVILPLWFLFYLWSTARPSFWTPTGREVPTAYAQALLPSVIVGYLLPTVLLYLPYDNVFITQGYIALWQFSPIYVNILLFIITPTYSIGQPKPESKKGVKIVAPADEIKYLNRVYIVTFILAAAFHWALIGLFPITSDPNVSLLRVFFPRKDLLLGEVAVPTVAEALHFIFQCDFWLIHAAGLFAAWISVLDVNRVAGTTLISGVKAAVVILINSVVFGPGAALVAIWYWREQTLARKTKSA